MPFFHTRKTDANDGNAILECLWAAFATYRSQYTPEAFADTVLDSETVQRRLREMRVFVAVSEGKIVGTVGCSVHGKRGHLRGMAVLPDWQGTAVASALLQAAEAELMASGCAYVTLGTTEPLMRAIRFYEKHGFSATGRVSDFFGMRLYEYSKSLSGELRDDESGGQS
jgi:ribosomal protein S18 acetylase RimI-like enzyme